MMGAGSGFIGGLVGGLVAAVGGYYYLTHIKGEDSFARKKDATALSTRVDELSKRVNTLNITIHGDPNDPNKPGLSRDVDNKLGTLTEAYNGLSSTLPQSIEKIVKEKMAAAEPRPKATPKPVAKRPASLDPLDKRVEQFSRVGIHAPYPVFREQLSTLIRTPTSPSQREKIYATVEGFLSARTETILGIRYDESVNGRRETVSWGMHYPAGWRQERIRVTVPFREISPYLSPHQKVAMALKVQPQKDPGPLLKGYTEFNKQTTAQLLQSRFPLGDLPKGPSIRELTDDRFSLYPPNAELRSGYGWVVLTK